MVNVCARFLGDEEYYGSIEKLAKIFQRIRDFVIDRKGRVCYYGYLRPLGRNCSLKTG